MTKRIIATILTLAILIACATAHTVWAETNTTAETIPVTTGEIVIDMPTQREPAWIPIGQGEFYATLTYEEDGVTIIEFNDQSWALIDRNCNPVEYVFQPAVMGDFAYTFSEEFDNDPHILFWGAIRTYQEIMYGVTLDCVIDGDGYNIMPFVFTSGEINSYDAHIADWKEMLESE